MKTPLSLAKRVTFVITALLALTMGGLPFFDFKQCERACRIHFGDASAKLAHRMDNRSVTGHRNGEDECVCEVDGVRMPNTIARYYPPHPPGYPYPHEFHVVCGVDGREYENADAAHRAGVKIINCGKCGSCSTVRDVSLYRKYATPMTKMLSRCALVYLFTSPYVGESLARACLQTTFEGGFSEPCLNRFIDNYGCVISHCYKQCILKWENPLSASNNDREGVSHFSGARDGTKLNPCMECDEMHCSPIFIESGAANRRMSGTITDVLRPSEEVCRHVDAV